MIKEKSAMDEIAEIVRCDDRFSSYDLIQLEPDISDGSSYDGFINFTDGFVDLKAEYIPKMDEQLWFSEKGSRGQKKRAENAQKIIDNMFTYNFRDFFDLHLQDAKDWLADFQKEFESADDFKKWFEKYDPYEKDPTPDLFDGKHYPLDRKHDRLYEYFLECDEDEYRESPAFVGVMVKLYDKDNWRGGGKRMARVTSYFNDDLSYGREHVGGWARLMGMVSADGSDIGNHEIYISEFQYTTFNDLKKKLRPRIQKAYESLNL